MQEANLSLGEQAAGTLDCLKCLHCPGMGRELRMVGLLIIIKMEYSSIFHNH